MLRQFFFIGLFICAISTGFSKTLNLKPQNEFFLITMPKSGTHQIMKLFYLLTGKYPHTHPHRNPNNEYRWMHFIKNERQVSENSLNSSVAIIAGIRDPRDVCVSAVDHLLHSRTSWLTPEQQARFNVMSFDDQLSFVINDRSGMSPMGHIKQVVSYIGDPRIVICPFEKLVGERGGGSLEDQLEQIKNISHALGLILTDTELTFLVENLFGLNETNEFKSTFRKGKIGSWKQCFNEKHKRMFKKNMGHELIQMGYEKDFHW